MHSYIGSKWRRRKDLCARLEAQGQATEYREPFVGGGSMFTEFLSRNPSVSKVWLNDQFPPVAKFWRAVRDNPDELIDALYRHTTDPDVLAHLYPVYMVKRLTAPDLEAAVMHHVMQMLSYDGNTVDRQTRRQGFFRWNPEFYENEITRVHALFRDRQVNITTADFGPVLSEVGDAAVFCDPPYWRMGDDLYAVKMSVADHHRLDAKLQRVSRFVLTYDASPYIRSLYRWATVEPVRLKVRQHRRWNDEFVITPSQG